MLSTSSHFFPFQNSLLYYQKMDQILISNTILLQNEPWLLGEMADSKAGADNIQDSLERLVVLESKEVLKKQK